MRSLLFTSSLVAAVLAGIALAGAGCPPLGTVTIPIDQYAPENPALDGSRLWQLAVCTPQPYSRCGSIAASYVIEINRNGDGCDVGFDTDASFGIWNDNYGGLNSFFSGTASTPGDRVANVTLICDEAATQPTNDGPVVASAAFAQGQTVWTFNVRVKTSAACGSTTPPPTPPPVTLPPPATSTPSGIVVAQYAAPQCVDAVASESFANPDCRALSSSGSLLRYCSGGAMQMQRFNASTTCQGMPVSVGSVAVGTCEESPMDGTSFSVTRCN